jgi:hypothetical protein
VVSAPETFITLVMAIAIIRTTHCMMPRWYSTAMKDAKKITVGSAWKMKTKPYLSWSAMPPRIIFEPSLVKPIRVTKTLPRPSKMLPPHVVISTNAAKAICSATPVPTNFQSTAFLLFENVHAMPISTAKPNRPKPIRVKASIVYSPGHRPN